MKCRHQTFSDGCHRCKLYRDNERYRAKWEGLPIPDSPQAVASSPCQFLGPALTGEERQAAKLDHRREWRHCLHVDQPLGPHVCRCRGCNPKCPGYAAEP